MCCMASHASLCGGGLPGARVAACLLCAAAEDSAYISVMAAIVLQVLLLMLR
jgi:hypothetical protein